MGSPQLSPLPPQQPRALHWMQQSPHHSTKAPLCPPGSPLRAAMVVGAPSPHLPPISPQCLLSSSPPAAASGEKQPPSSLLPLSLPPPLSLPGASSQSGSELPWRQEGHVKSFFTVLRRQGGEDSGGGSGTIVTALIQATQVAASPFPPQPGPLPSPLCWLGNEAYLLGKETAAAASPAARTCSPVSSP